MPKMPDRVDRPWIKKGETRPWQDQQRQDSQAFYHSMAWRNLRNRYIRQHPLCVECQRNGFHTPGYVVDHIVPIKSGGSKWSESNLQTLCEKCHNKKRATEK